MDGQMLDWTNIIKYGFGSVLLFGGGFYILNWFKSGKLSDLKDILHTQKQDEGMKKIESIQAEQAKIEANIKGLENQSVEKQVLIRKTVDEAAAKIDNIMKETDHQKIDDAVNKGWNKDDL
jgi:folate-dependent phosphoribosylglycinamide formyltransferase PurN